MTLIRSITKNFLKRLNGSVKYLSTTQTQIDDDDKDTHFGFQTVKESEKGKHIYDLYTNVASDYDKMNDVMSFGLHRIWRDIFMCRFRPTKNTNLIDVAGGTGDITFRFLNYIKNNKLTGCHVTVCDINTHMMEVGKKRCKALNHDPSLISWKQGDAENLPFENESFNAYTVAFGMRNFTRMDKVLKEAYRVLQPGGRFMCLELSHVENDIAKWFYDQYSFQIIPVMGQIMTGKRQPYQYVVESVRKFPDQETFKTAIEEAGFRQVTYENLTLGVVAIHSGFKL